MSTDANVVSTDSSIPPSEDEYVISETQLGIWKLFIATHKGGKGVWGEIRETLPFVRRLFNDIYEVSPRWLGLMLLSMCWNGVELSLDMRMQNILLKQMERSIKGKANLRTTLIAIGLKIMHVIMNFYVRRSTEFDILPLQNRLVRHFELQVMEARLFTDLPTATETSEREVNPESALAAVKELLLTVQSVFQIFSQILLMLKITRLRGTKMLLSIVFLQAILARFYPKPSWDLVAYTYINNDAYQRAQSIKSFAQGGFLQDIIGNNLGNWISTEYRKASAALGDVCTDHAFFQYYHRRETFLSAIRDFFGILPPIYFTILAVKYPRYISIASAATLQSSARSVFTSVNELYSAMRQVPENLHMLSKIYTPKTPNVMKDGTLCLTEKEETQSKGMSLVLKDVSFAYPGGERKKNVLSGVNLEINAGQLVIVVGANGSGKSTLTRILARLYDPSSGEFFIEGQPSTEYRIADLRSTIALLSQDNEVYPLSMAENIGLGYPERSTDLEMIKEAAREGGAAEFIEEMENGYETMLESFRQAHHSNLDGNREHPLWIMSEKLEKTLDISGGQRQRIIAARAFMSFKSGKVKLAIVDEPSSALDADAELRLFQRLMSVRKGRTMVVVTHRFGHLTKFADQIICMKDGTIVESGSHGELISAGGEYANLYKIQAQAFSEGADPPVSSLLELETKDLERHGPKS